MRFQAQCVVAVLMVALGLTAQRSSAAEDPALIHPEQIDRCLKGPGAAMVAVNTATNPYYLRGDFDGDGKVDYAVSVSGRKTKRNGVLMCTGNGRVSVVGADQPLNPPFSDMPDDNFFAPNWMVYSKSETLELDQYVAAVPKPLPQIRGETIAMIWEDGISLIYWNGKEYKWAASCSSCSTVPPKAK